MFWDEWNAVCCSCCSSNCGGRVGHVVQLMLCPGFLYLVTCSVDTRTQDTTSAGQRAPPGHHSFCYNNYSTQHSTHPGTPPYSASHKINKAATLRHKVYNSLNYTTASTSHQHHDSDLIAQKTYSISNHRQPGHRTHATLQQ